MTNDTNPGRRFWKMHGAGNDFAIFDARAQKLALPPEAVAPLADRHTGIGFDQLILLEPPRHPDAALFMRILNADGSEAGACGNATRCVAWLIAEESGADHAIIETRAGLLPTRRTGPGQFEVGMGVPSLDWRSIPLSREADTLHLPLPGDPAACSMGNPHATLFVENLDATPIAALGPSLEHHPLFPDRANIGFAQILAPDRIRLRVWERGAGLTRACGSGACAALVNAVRRGLSERAATLVLDGGELRIGWGMDGRVTMDGPAALAYRGEVPPAGRGKAPARRRHA